MVIPGQPRVVWSLLCSKAERDRGGFLHLEKVIRTIPQLIDPVARQGVRLTLAFGVEFRANTTATLDLTIRRPTGRRHVLDTVPLEFGDSGFRDEGIELVGLPIEEAGDYRVQFRWNGEADPSHETTLRVVAVPAEPSPRTH